MIRLEIEEDDIAAVQAALRTRRDYSFARMEMAVPESQIQDHHRTRANSLDRVLRSIAIALENEQEDDQRRTPRSYRT